MEIKQKKRCEVDEKYKWDLTSIYKNNEEIDKEINDINELALKITQFKTIDLDSNNLYELLSLDAELSRKAEKLMMYSSLKVSEEANNSANQELYGKIMNIVQDISVKVSFVQNKILGSKYEDVKKYIRENSKLEEYEFFLEDLFRGKKYILVKKEEELISNFSNALSLAEETYDMLTNSDMKFGNIIDEDGREVELTHSNYSKYSKSKDRRVRKDAFDRFYSTFGKYRFTISKLYSSHLETNNIISKMRGYESMLASDLFSDNLDEQVYDNLINTVNDNLSTLHRYYKIKKDMLNLEEFHIYDNGAEVVDDIDKKYSFDDAKDIILDTFKIMGEKYTDILKEAFDNRWIDVYNNEGKQSGAFSAGCYDSNPYVLTNYEDKIDDVSALAHELGHSVHSYLSIHKNSYQYYDYSHFIAEVASLTNEIVLNKKLIENENDPKVKLYILNNLIKLFASNLFDATLYAEFEKDVHEKIEAGEVLTNDYFNELCLKLNEKYYGEDVVVDNQIKYRWEIYSHLYSDFYLYKYATGISSACYCASKILDNDEEFINKYIKFLESGGSKYPHDTLKIIDIDVYSEDFITNSINFFNKLLDEFERIYKDIK